MIRHAIVAACVTLCVTQPLRAYQPSDTAEPVKAYRGEIRDFYVKAYAVYSKHWTEVDAMAFEDQRVFDGDRWLSLKSPEGAAFLRRYEQQIRDGQIDAE